MLLSKTKTTLYYKIKQIRIYINLMKKLSTGRLPCVSETPGMQQSGRAEARGVEDLENVEHRAALKQKNWRERASHGLC